MSLKNVVKATIFLSDLAKDFNAVNEVCATSFVADPPAILLSSSSREGRSGLTALTRVIRYGRR